MTSTVPDAVDAILGITPGSPLDGLRRRRPVTRDNTQASYLALFHPQEPGEADQTERAAVAVFVASLHGSAAADFYSRSLTGAGEIRAAVLKAATSAAARGPYGEYRELRLRGEDRPGLRWAADAALRKALGSRLAAALEHAHLLVFRPRESSPAALEVLMAAGWSATGIVTLSQLVAFLSYQLRVIAGLELLAAEAADLADIQTVRIGS